MMTNAHSILAALIQVKKSFECRAKTLNPSLLTETKFDKEGRPIYTLGETTPSWMQKLARDALGYMRLYSKHDCFLYLVYIINPSCIDIKVAF